MKKYREMDVQIHVFFTSTLVGGEWSVSHTCHSPPREKAPSTHWIGAWVDLRAGTDDMKK
jgi:hypothetical protein